MTVVLPAFDAASSLGRTLDALTTLDVPTGGDYEIVVSDDGSTDATIELARVYRFVRVITGARSGPAGARNRGAEAAIGDVLAFVDSGDEPSPSWLRQIVEVFGDPVVGLASWPATVVDTAQGREQLRRPGDDPSEVVSLASCFAVRRSIFEAVGGYDAALRCGENTDLCERAAANCANGGYRIAVGHEVVVRVLLDQSPEHYDRPRLDAAEHLLTRDARLLAANRPREVQLHAIAAVNAARCDEWVKARRHAWAAMRRGRSWRDAARLVVASLPPLARRRWCAPGRRRLPTAG